MANRILTWYLPEIVGNGTSQGPTFIADRDYNPREARIYAGDKPDADQLIVTFRDDGTSIGVSRLAKGANNEPLAGNWDRAIETLIEKYSAISLDVTQSGGAKKITVQLELEDALGNSAGEGYDLDD